MRVAAQIEEGEQISVIRHLGLMAEKRA